jgi:hypothetical protein
MFTTVNNSALNLSSAFSTMLLGIWDVSKEALENEQLRGLINLTCLTTAIQVSGVLFVGLLPEYKEDLERLRVMRGGSSRIGGMIFLFITLSSIVSTGFWAKISPQPRICSN